MNQRVVWLDKYCHACGEQLNSWDKRCSEALGYHFHVCEKCIAAEYDQTADELRYMLKSHFGMLPCLGL